jgi:hypothetical protein
MPFAIVWAVVGDPSLGFDSLYDFVSKGSGELS